MSKKYTSPVDNSLQYTPTQGMPIESNRTHDKDVGQIIQNNEEILEFVQQIKVMNKHLLILLERQKEEMQELRMHIEELYCQLQQKNETIEQNQVIIQECEIQLESQREQNEIRLAQLEVQLTMGLMVNKIEIQDEYQTLMDQKQQEINEMMNQFKSANKLKTGYSTTAATSLLQSSLNHKMHIQHSDSLFRDSNTIESMNQADGDSSLQNSLIDQRRNSYTNNQPNKFMLRGILKNENIDPHSQQRFIQNQKDSLKKEINQWQDEFMRQEGRVPTRNDKAVISSKFYQYAQLKKQLTDRSILGSQDRSLYDKQCQSIGIQVNLLDTVMQTNRCRIDSMHIEDIISPAQQGIKLKGLSIPNQDALESYWYKNNKNKINNHRQF